MKHCSKCNKEFSDEDSFCDECGGKLKKKELVDKSEKKEESKKESREKTRGRLRTPRWYLVDSIVLIVILVLEFFLYLTPYIFRLSQETMVIIIAITGIGWAVFNFFIAIYFLARKYEKISIILPVTFIVQALITMPIINFSDNIFFIEAGIFLLFVIGFSLYFLLKD